MAHDVRKTTQRPGIRGKSIIGFGKNNPAFRETLIALALTFAWNEAVYIGARLIAQSWHHYDMTTWVDGLVPFLPWTVSIYFGCYLFWCVNYYISASHSKARRDRFLCADVLSKGVCLILFLLIPTTNVRPEITGDTLWDNLMRLLYQIDAADNLFPSIHCLVSWLCWVGIRTRKDIPAIYRHFSLAAAIAICISTVTTRQHAIADVFGGIVLAEGCYFIAGFPKVCAIYSRFLARVMSIFPK